MRRKVRNWAESRPLGHRDQLQALAEADDGAGQLGVVAGVAEPLHEGSVDLEDVGWKRCR